MKFMSFYSEGLGHLKLGDSRSDLSGTLMENVGLKD